MVRDEQKRLIELYEKGVLTKDEAKACFLELEESPDFVFVEEKARLTFTLPSLKVFSSSKLKQDYHFEDIESMKISLVKGKIVFQKHKQADIRLTITYPQSTKETLLPQIYVERKALHFFSPLTCQLVVSLPDRWMSVLELEVGEADTRLDYLPFEDVTIQSSSEKKQQDIRVTLDSHHSQHLHMSIDHAPIHVIVPKSQGVKGKIESKKGIVQMNRRKKESPYICEKKGKETLYLHIQTESSPLNVKGITHAWHL